jgi:hypothetical protein
VGGPTGYAACHLIARGQLLFDDDADVGKSGDVPGDLPLVALAVGFLEQGVADEAGGHHLLHRIKVCLGSCLREPADQGHVLLGRHGASSSPTRGSAATDTCIMPPGGLRHIGRRPIHRSA